MPTTLRNTDILFNDGTTQSTAATAGGLVTTANVLNATAGASHAGVGTYTIAWNASTSNVSSGGTLAGSNLRYRTAAPTAMFGNVGSANGTSNPPFPTPNYSALSGTWRNMGSFCSGRVMSGSGGVEDPYVGTWYPSMWLRIA